MAKKTTARRRPKPAASKISKKPAKQSAKKAAKAPIALKKTSAKTPVAKARSFTPAKHTSGRAASAKPGMSEARTDFNQPGEVAIERMPEPSRSIARAADAMIRASVPACECVVKWGNPVYSTGQGAARKAFAAIMETRKGINLALPGVALIDPHGLLEGTGKTMRHVKLHDPDAPNSDAVKALVTQARAVGLEGM